jgi:hypothetical protein
MKKTNAVKKHKIRLKWKELFKCKTFKKLAHFCSLITNLRVRPVFMSRFSKILKLTKLLIMGKQDLGKNAVL